MTKKNFIIIFFLILTVFVNWTSSIDLIATENLSDSIYRSSVVFAFAKGLNAAISVVQGTQISVSPIGLGFTISIGELLDPINDIVEQFSNLMLISSVALGIQKVLISIGSHHLVKWSLTCVAFFLILYWIVNKKSSRNISKIFIMLAMIRFAVPVATIGSDQLFNAFLDSQYRTSKDSIVDRTTEIKLISTETDASPIVKKTMVNESWWQLHLPNIPSMDDFRNGIDKIERSVKDIAEKTTDDIVNLLVVFTLQTIIFPIFLLFALYRISIGFIL